MIDSKILNMCFDKPFSDLKDLMKKASEYKHTVFSNTVHFYQLTDNSKFVSISITGSYCNLNCEHCKGSLLKNMIHVHTPQQLLELCTDLKKNGCEGCLISGGSDNQGNVPLMRFLPILRKVKKDLGMRVVVHTGLINSTLAKSLADTRVDSAMIDIIGSNETIQKVYHLDCSVESFDRSLSNLDKYDIPTAPHIVVGIHYGKILGERKAVEIISKHHPKAIVVVALMPLTNTKMMNISPPSHHDVGRVLLALRLLNPKTPLLLGCIRPKGIHKVMTESIAISTGVNGIANPSKETVRFANKMGFKVKLHNECCSLIGQELLFDQKKQLSL